MTADKLLAACIVDGIVAEPLGGAYLDPATAAKNLKAALLANLTILNGMPLGTLLEQRYQKYRKLGVYHETPPPVGAKKPVVKV